MLNHHYEDQELLSPAHALFCLCPCHQWILLPSFLRSQIMSTGRRKHRRVKVPSWGKSRLGHSRFWQSGNTWFKFSDHTLMPTAQAGWCHSKLRPMLIKTDSAAVQTHTDVSLLMKGAVVSLPTLMLGCPVLSGSVVLCVVPTHLQGKCISVQLWRVLRVLKALLHYLVWPFPAWAEWRHTPRHRDHVPVKLYQHCP